MHKYTGHFIGVHRCMLLHVRSPHGAAAMGLCTAAEFHWGCSAWCCWPNLGNWPVAPLHRGRAALGVLVELKDNLWGRPQKQIARLWAVTNYLLNCMHSLRHVLYEISSQTLGTTSRARARRARLGEFLPPSHPTFHVPLARRMHWYTASSHAVLAISCQL